MKSIRDLTTIILVRFICAAFTPFTGNAEVINCSKLKGNGQVK